MKRKSSRHIIAMRLGMMVFVCLIVTGLLKNSVSASEAKKITLKGVAFLPLNVTGQEKYKEFAKKVTERSNGELVIDLIGGPETIPAFDQVEALKNGIVDIIQMSGNYYWSVVPEARSFHLAQANPMEQRKTGYYDAMNDAHKKAGLFYLGRARWGKGFYLYTNLYVKTPKELAGKKFRSAAIYNAFMTELGITPIVMKPPDIYTAMERGVVEGFGWADSGVYQRGWAEVTKYRIEHPFYTNNTVVLLNLKKWKSLPRHLQDLMVEVIKEIEPEAVEHFISISDKEKEQLSNAGMKFIEFSPSDAEWYVKTAYDAAWKDLYKHLPAATADKLRQLSQKPGS